MNCMRVVRTATALDARMGRNDDLIPAKTLFANSALDIRVSPADRGTAVMIDEQMLGRTYVEILHL